MTTRRNILKGGAGLAAILATGKAPAYIVKSMLAARNSIVTKSGGAKLPYDAEVEYLESTGTQWIDTGIDPSICNSQTMVFDSTFALRSSSSTYTGIFGAAVPRFGAYAINNNLCFGYYAAADNVYQISYDTQYTLNLSLAKGSQMAKLNGTTIWTNTNSGTLTDTYTIGLFCRNYSPVQWMNNLRIYGCKIYVANNLVRDFIPVRVGTTGYMYDRVSGKLFGNQGTGNFIVGPDVV